MVGERDDAATAPADVPDGATVVGRYAYDAARVVLTFRETAASG